MNHELFRQVGANVLTAANERADNDALTALGVLLREAAKREGIHILSVTIDNDTFRALAGLLSLLEDALTDMDKLNFGCFVVRFIVGEAARDPSKPARDAVH
jgi:hypothetical protein